MRLIEHRPDRYLRAPRLVRGDGGLELWTIATEADGESVLAFDLPADDSRSLPEPRTTYSAEAVVALTRSDRPEASDDAADWQRAARGDWRVWLERQKGWSEVWARSGAKSTLVWRAWGTAAAPDVLPVAGGAWVAFHHNVREDSGGVDLAKWIAVRFVDDDGRVFEPERAMTDRDRDRLGEEQGFEFPTLAEGPGGAITVFGRGSHAYYRQDLDERGFAARELLEPGTWGCRGRWVSARRDGGQIVTARREKKGLVIQRVEAPRGRRAALIPAEIEVRGERVGRPHHPVPARPRGADPAAADGRRTLFGDIHQHSAHSDGCGAPEEPYLRARYLYGDDFCALTDHESFIGKRIGPGEWRHLCEVAERHDQPGEFATLLAYEWTGRMYPGPGHKVVYLPPGGGPIVSRDDVPGGAELVARVKELGGFAVPHHVGWTGADEDAHDPVGQPVWEICSCHGCYLTADHPLGSRGDLRDQMVEEVLRRGRRFGFIACSDGHGLLFHHGVARKRDPFRCGLTAVQAESCSRESILQAIRARRCYATSGVPILLDLRVDGSPMGSELCVDGPVEVRAVASCATPIRSLSLHGPAGELARELGDGTTLGLALERAVTVRAGGFLYARVEQEDGEMAWSSPVFFDAPSS